MTTARLGWIERGALVVALITLLAAIAIRPFWRDEYWAIYFAGSDIPLMDAVLGRITADVHPPLYFIILHYWGMVSQSDIWLRCLNLVFFAGLGAATWRVLRPAAELRWIALLLLATGYWAIFFGTELRMYALMLMACALMTAAMVRAVDTPRLGFAAVFAAGGLLASGSHVFGGMWTACAGLCVGLLMARRGRWDQFLAWGVASLIAIAPLAIWVLLFRPDQNSGAPQETAPPLVALDLGWEQFSRALFVKTFGANIAAFVLLCMAGRRLLKRPAAVEGVLWGAVILVTLASFAIQILYLPLIKERAFIVIVPAVVMLMAIAVADAKAAGRRPRWVAAVSVLAVIAPLLFAPEHLKDREEIGKAVALLEQPGCKGGEVAMYLRPSGQGEGYTEFVTRRVLRDVAERQGISLVDVQELGRDGVARVIAGACPVKLVAFTLPRGSDPEHGRMDAMLAGLGIGGAGLVKESFGEGRSVAFVRADTASRP